MFYALTTIKIKKLNSKEIKKIDLQFKDFFKKKSLGFWIPSYICQFS